MFAFSMLMSFCVGVMVMSSAYVVSIAGACGVGCVSSVFSSAFAITERSEMGLYDVPMFMSLFGFGIGMMFASFHV